jgi:cellulose synthase (UDP-forming)
VNSRNPTTEVVTDDRAEAVARRSGGTVLAISPVGPVFRGRRAPRRSFRPDTFVPALAARDRMVVAGLTVAWLACVAWFWVWWLQPENRVNWVGLLATSVVPLYLSCEPISYLLAANRLRRVDLPLPSLRVAFVVTRAPSEPWLVARTTLSAMLAQDYPYSYDVWLCDEQPTEEITAWCAEHGVRVSTRSGVAGYNLVDWPRRTRCKEGNLAYFYDHVAYDDYDVVAHLDCDHVPAPGDLAEMVRPFGDPAVGYVAAPSNCDRNAVSSWTVRGRLHREAYFHGPVQLGHSDGLAPISVGSQWALRTAAVKEIGGIGPELLEDFSTSFLLTSAGWQGAFAIGAEAHGNGPLTFSAMLVQEFQWTRSQTALLYRLVPPHLRRLSWGLRMRFLYAMLFHTALVLTIVCGLALTAVAAATGTAPVTANPLYAVVFWVAISVWLLLLTAVLRRRGLLRPVDAPLLSWENWLYRLTRWPFIAWGVCAAAVARLRPRPVTIKVTPKVVDGLERLPARLIAPHVVISVVLAAAVLAGPRVTTYGLLCLLGAVICLVVPFAVCLLHAADTARTAGVRLGRVIGETVRVPLLVSALAIPPVVAGIIDYCVQ